MQNHPSQKSQWSAVEFFPVLPLVVIVYCVHSMLLLLLLLLFRYCGMSPSRVVKLTSTGERVIIRTLSTFATCTRMSLWVIAASWSSWSGELTMPSGGCGLDVACGKLMAAMHVSVKI